MTDLRNFPSASDPRRRALQGFRVEGRTVEGSAVKKASIDHEPEADYDYQYTADRPRPGLTYTYSPGYRLKPSHIPGEVEAISVTVSPVQVTIDRYGALSPMVTGTQYITEQARDSEGRLLFKHEDDQPKPVFVLVEIRRDVGFFGPYGLDPNDPGRCVTRTQHRRGAR